MTLADRIRIIIAELAYQRAIDARKRKAYRDLEADRQKRLAFDRLAREDKRAMRRLEKAMRVG